MKDLSEISETLNKNYSKIPDFKTYVIGDKIVGGFAKQRFFDRICGNGWVEYYFHETFGRLIESVDTYAKLFDFLDATIQKQLKWQKGIDEDFAKEKEIDIEYSYNYPELIKS